MVDAPMCLAKGDASGRVAWSTHRPGAPDRAPPPQCCAAAEPSGAMLQMVMVTRYAEPTGV